MISRKPTLALAALLASSLAFTADRSAAEGTPSCDGSVGGFELKPMPEHSSVHPKGLMCNYSMNSTDGQNNTSGMAITIEYDCPTRIQEAFKSKTGARKRYDRSADVTRGELSRSGTSLLLREDRGGEGYAGSFSVQEKMFLLIDSQTIATIVVLTDVKPPPPSKSENAPAPEADPDVLVFSADQAAGLAQSLAGAHAGLKANLQCGAGPAEVEPEKPPEMTLQVKLDLTTVSGRREIPFGETVSFPAKVSATGKDSKEAVAAKHFAPIDVELHRDDTLVEKKTTDGEGGVTFTYTPPDNTPDDECKKHSFKAVASKEGVGSAEDVLDAEIQRGVCERVIVRVTRDGAEIPHDDPPILFTPVKEAPVRFRLEARLEPERMVKQFLFQLGGPLARFASIEEATPTGTPGEWEVRDTERAAAVLVVSPFSEDFEASLGAEGGIRLEVRASPD